MSIADGAQHSIHYVPEVKYGVTPNSPKFLPLPHTGTTLGLTKEGMESQKLTGDRHVEDFRHGNRTAGGEVSAELEYSHSHDFLQALMCGTWATDVLKVGAKRRSFTVERKFADLKMPEWHRFTGCEVNSMSISVAPNAAIGVTFGLVGQNAIAPATSKISGSTYAPDEGEHPFDSFTGTIKEGGSPIAVVTSLELKLENGIEPRFVVGSNVTIRPSIGKSRVTGTLTAFYENKALYEKFLNETESDIVFTLTDPDGNDLEFNIARVKYNSGQPDVSGEGSVTVSMEFVGLYSATDASSLIITRKDDTSNAPT